MPALDPASRPDPPHPLRRTIRLRWAARLVLYAAFLLVSTLLPASAVLLISGNGNTSAPAGADDPGFAHVGEKSSGGLTLIYLGNGWVLTAAHVTQTDFKLNSIVYPHVPGSGVQFLDDDGSAADLLAFQILGAPHLPDLPILEISSVSPSIGAEVTMIGRGYNRDGAISWRELSPPFKRHEGWSWGASGGAIRWGTNRVADPSEFDSATTDSFVVDFTKPGDTGVTTHEAHSVVGDSGGAVFAKNGTGEWELAGIMFAASGYSGQPAATALDGNLTYSADLARFRDQLIPLVRPECSDEVDNDGDGKVDYPEDPGCSSREALSEADAVPSVPSLGRSALGVLGALLVAVSLLTSRSVSDPSD